LERIAEKVIRGASNKTLKLGPIESGASFSDVDRQTMMAISHVMDMPELVSAN
jgi:hypothetical protein